MEGWLEPGAAPLPPSPKAPSICVLPHAQPATPTPTRSMMTAMPPLATILANHSRRTGKTIVHIDTARRVDPTPARKLLRWGCKEGR